MKARDAAARLDVCFVNMPHFYLQCPSLALGLLKSLVERSGFSARVVYANLVYADTISPRTLDAMRTGSKYLSEWLFGRTVFPDRDPNGWSRLGAGHTLVEEPEAERCAAIAAAQDEADAFIDRQAFEVLKGSPRIVGCTSFAFQHLPALALLKRVRELRPDVITMMGGPNCEEERGVATHRLFPWVDYVVSGDADELIGPLISRILSRDSDTPADELPEGVFGPIHRRVGYPEGPGGVAPRAVARSLAASPVPDYTEYFETLSSSKRLRNVVKPFLPIETSRGCWWAIKQPCTFCGVNGVRQDYAVKPHARTLSEMDALHGRHRVTRFAFNDNMLSTNYFHTLLPELKRRGRPYRIFCQLTARLKEEDVRLLGEAGFEQVQPGIESLHTEALTAFRKGTEAWQNIQMLKWCLQYGVAVTWALLSDVPGDRDDWYGDMARLVPLLAHLPPPRRLGQLFFSRNSEYHRHPDDYGLHLVPDDDAAILYPLPQSDLAKLVLIFEDAERETRSRDEMRFLFDPGLHALGKAVERWRANYVSPLGPRPALAMEDSGTTLTIRDSRPVAVQSVIELSGLARDVYLECWSAPTDRELVERFEARGLAADDLAAVLASLEAKKILVAIDGRRLALATRQPCAATSDEGWFELTGADLQGETAQLAAISS